MNLLLLPADFNDSTSHLAPKKCDVPTSAKNIHEHNLSITNSCEINDTRQILHVQQHLNAQVGDSIKVGQINGYKGTAIIQAMSAHQLILSDIALTLAPPPALPITLILALPRPKVFKRMIMDAVTLGFKHIYIVNAARVDKSYWQSPLLKQLDEFVQLGLEQASDTIWPLIHFKQRLKPFVQDELPKLLSAQNNANTAYLVHPYQSSMALPQLKTQKHAVVAIGCEGGWVPFEVNLFSEVGFKVAHLGERILRTETALSFVCGKMVP